VSAERVVAEDAPPRMRVLLSCPYSLSTVGGVQGQVLGLARALRSFGVDARVVAPCDGPPPEPGITSVGASTRMPSNGSVAPIAVGRAVARRTLEAARTFAPDVLHLHEPLAPGANHALLVGTGIPAVGTFHSARLGRNAWYETFRSGLRPMLRRLSVRTAVSEEAKRQVEQTFGAECEIMPNGVDVARFASGPATASGRPAVLFIGRHEPRKGLDVLLEAFSRIGSDAELWVAGDGQRTPTLRARRDAAASGQVTWLGRIPEREKEERLRGATVACFPAIEGESFGVVLLEAMASGTPVVASDIEGYRTVSRSGREALLVPPGDPAALADALRRILDDCVLRERLVVAGHERAAEFAMDDLARRFVDAYRRASRVRAAGTVT
jgi:phosphatidyl-myo-inositol alpha-mannosyltransferase